jgi:prohibitin 2
MGFLVLTIIAGIVCLIAILMLFTSKSAGARSPATIVASVAALFAIAMIIVGSALTVPNGSVAVMTRFGRVTGDIKEAGFSWKAMVDAPQVMSIQTQKYEEDAAAASKDLQDVTTKIAINYKLDKARAAEVYRTIGHSFINIIAMPAIQEVSKSVIARYNAEDMILKRESVRTDIYITLKDVLAQRGIIVEQLNITNFTFSSEFTRAIEAKVVAQQNVLQAQNKLEQIKVEAQQAEAAAKGQAAAAIAMANGDAESLRIRAEAVQAANLTADMLQYLFITTMNDNVQIWVVPEGQAFTVNAK